MFARILSLLVGLAVAGAACLSNPTPHPGKPRPHESDPNQVGTVVDPNDQKTGDVDPNAMNPTAAGTEDCDRDNAEGADAADATAGVDVGEDAPPTPEGDVDEAGCDAGTEADTGPDAATSGAAEFGHVNDP